MFTPNGQLFVNNKSGILTVKIDKVEFTGPTLASVLHQYRDYKRLPELPTSGYQQLKALAQLAEKNPTPVLRRTPPPRTVAAPPRTVAAPPRTVAAPPRTVAAPPRTVAGPAAAQTVAGPATLASQNRAGRLGLNAAQQANTLAAQQANTLAAQQAKTLAAQQAKTLAAQQAAEESFRTLATEQAAQRAAQQARTLASLPHLKRRIVDTTGSPQRLPAQGQPLTNHEKHSLLGWVSKASPNPAAY